MIITVDKNCNFVIRKFSWQILKIFPSKYDFRFNHNLIIRIKPKINITDINLGIFAAHFVTNGLLNTCERIEFRGMMICMGHALEECRKGSR